MLTRIHIDNYKCLTNFDLRLDNLTLLAGANGCGKSAVFEVVGKLRDLACDSRVDSLFFADDLTRWTTKREQRFELEFSRRSGAFLYELVIEHKPDDRGVEVKAERLTHDGKPALSFCDRRLQLYRDDGSEGLAYPFGPHRSALATESDKHLYSRLHRFRDLLSSFQTLSLVPSGAESGSEGESDVLIADGKNFAAWYRGQILNDPRQLQQATNRLAEVLPGFTGLKLSARIGDYRELLATFSQGDDGASHSYTFDQLSDGQRALIVLYSLVFATIPDSGPPDASGSVPRTLFLDEPDNYVTLPELQPWLAELEDGAGDTLPQAVLISHHPEAIDFLAHNTVWLAREPESHTRVVEPKNDTGLRMSEVYARGWTP
ncbi:MAG: AAA family ATPase [Acidobacteria bacterium]|nr:AAA family ATPase [Acidobacteriota bacterium]